MFRATLAKDVALLARDRGALASLFLLPIIFIGIFGAMFGDGTIPPSTVPIFVESPSAETQQLITALNAAPTIGVQPVSSPEEVRQLVARENADYGLVLSTSFDPLHGHPGELVIDEAMHMQNRVRLEGELTGITLAASLGYTSPPPLFYAKTPPGMRSHIRGISGFQLSVPSNVVLFGFFLALTVALSFLEERNTGTFRRILAAPVPRATTVISKLAPFFIVGIVQMFFLFAISIVVFGLQVRGGYLELIALTATIVLCATCLGLLIASLSNTEKQVGAIGSICLLVMA